MQGRNFNGKKYYYNGYFTSKAEAKARVARLRKEGNLARIVATSHGYEVWDRRKILR